MKKLKIAVTGGIGSGKSSVCEVFKSKGYAVISSDIVAKELMLYNADVKKKIIKNFGSSSYIDGKLNIEYLSNKVFSNPEKNKLINSIVHPATTKEVENRAAKELQEKDIVFIESALIYEAKIHKNFDFVILVLSSDEEKIARVVRRDNVNPTSVIERMNNQIPDVDKKEKADFVIKNNTSLDELRSRSNLILGIIESLSIGE